MGREAGDAISQNRWSETIEKEMKVRLQWKEKYGKEYASGDAENFKLARKKRASHLPEFSGDTAAPVKAVASPEKKVVDLEPLLDDTDLPVFEMYPVTPATKTKLYDGFSREGKGRALYLKERKSNGPEAKFPYPVTEAQEVGWKQEEKGNQGKPKFGRSQTIKTFYRENGVFYSNGEILPKT